MIEAKQLMAYGFIFEIDAIWVALWRASRASRPQVAAGKRAEHIAAALRHYQQSQEGEKVP